MNTSSNGNIIPAEQTYPDLASAHHGLIRTILEAGIEQSVGDSLSIGANRTTLDLSNYQLLISTPIRRMISDPTSFNFVRALARFLWLASGNDRLADIAIYDPGAVRFSDDGLRIPGSNFGTRLFCPRPGLNPVARLIDLFERDRGTRRGTIPIFSADDVGRESRDIPCALAAHFRVHEDRLHMTMMMRSNNAFRLFPYNGFEFSMLHETIARHLDVDVGTYTHYAISMHIYSEDIDAAKAYCDEFQYRLPSDFSWMPKTPRPLEQITVVASLEGRFRNAFLFGGPKMATEVIAEASETLCEYWNSYFLCLALDLSRRGGYFDLSNEIGFRLRELAILPFCRYPDIN